MQRRNAVRIFQSAYVLASIILLCFSLAGCPYEQEKLEEEKIENVSRVFMHEPKRYSLIVGRQRGFLRTLFVHNAGNVEFFADVPPDQAMWVLVKKTNHEVNDNDFENIEIHLHSFSEINGAGWNHGKHGRGQTVVVE